MPRIQAFDCLERDKYKIFTETMNDNITGLKKPISYYGGKQNLITTLVPLFPDHTLYAEFLLVGDLCPGLNLPQKLK